MGTPSPSPRRRGKELWKNQDRGTLSGRDHARRSPGREASGHCRRVGGELGIHGWLKGSISRRAGSFGPPTTSAPTATCGEGGDVPAVLRCGADLALTTWPADVWKNGGAPVWGWMSYDPSLDLLYYGTGNPAPYNPEQRRRTTMDGQRAGPPTGGRDAGVGIPVHAARQLGLRCDLGDDPWRPVREWPATEGLGPFRQERLCVHHGPDHG